MIEREPPELAIYGYGVAWRKKPKVGQRDPKSLPAWQIEQCEEYLHLPAHYPSLEEAVDRANHMRSKGVEVRVMALVAEPTDTAEEFERSKANG